MNKNNYMEIISDCADIIYEISNCGNKDIPKSSVNGIEMTLEHLKWNLIEIGIEFPKTTDLEQ